MPACYIVTKFALYPTTQYCHSFETEVYQENRHLTLVTLTFDLENQPSTSPNG